MLLPCSTPAVFVLVVRAPCSRLLEISLSSTSRSIFIPRSIHEAIQNPKWVTAAKIKMNTLQQNQTWELVDVPLGEWLVGCKWAFNVKYPADDAIWYMESLIA